MGAIVRSFGLTSDYTVLANFSHFSCRIASSLARSLRLRTGMDARESQVRRDVKICYVRVKASSGTNGI